MKAILCAPDSFKGSLTAPQVARAMARGIENYLPEAPVVELPLSDGGEGLVESLLVSTGGTWRQALVTGPLGKKVKAHYGILGDGKTAVMEMASASGLPLLSPEERNPLLTTTYGTGELLREILALQCKRVIIGIGGSATNDGGMGMARALGVEFYDAQGKPLAQGGGDLLRLDRIQIGNLSKARSLEILIACDVDNPMTGPRGASAIYGPQKGATPEMIPILDQGLQQLSHVFRQTLGVDVESLPGAGAAGGLGGTLMALLGGKLQRGIDLVLETIHFSTHVKNASVILTGEGSLDAQTAYGKVIMGVCQHASDVPVIALAGNIEQEAGTLHNYGLTACFPVLPGPMSLQEAMEGAETFIRHRAEEVIRLFFAGMEQKK